MGGHVFQHLQGHLLGSLRPGLVPSGTGSAGTGPGGNGGILLEDGTSYLLLESGDYILME